MSGVKITAATNGGSAEIAGPPDSSANTVLKLPADTGAAGKVLKVKSANHSATNAELEWAADAGGKMLSTPIVSSTSTAYDFTSTTYTDTDLTASITPSATSSKILVQCNLSNQSYANQTAVALGIRLLRDTTTAFTVDVFSMMNDNAAVDYYAYGFFFWLDSPSTTSAITYKIQGARTYTSGSGTLKASLNQNSSIGDGSESYLMLTEIAG